MPDLVHPGGIPHSSCASRRGSQESPREGDHMGTATVTGFEDGSPVLSVHFDGQP
jgi:hypothetical protein